MSTNYEERLARLTEVAMPQTQTLYLNKDGEFKAIYGPAPDEAIMSVQTETQGTSGLEELKAMVRKSIEVYGELHDPAKLIEHIENSADSTEILSMIGRFSGDAKSLDRFGPKIIFVDEKLEIGLDDKRFQRLFGAKTHLPSLSPRIVIGFDEKQFSTQLRIITLAGQVTIDKIPSLDSRKSLSPSEILQVIKTSLGLTDGVVTMTLIGEKRVGNLPFMRVVDFATTDKRLPQLTLSGTDPDEVRKQLKLAAEELEEDDQSCEVTLKRMFLSGLLRSFVEGLGDLEDLDGDVEKIYVWNGSGFDPVTENTNSLMPRIYLLATPNGDSVWGVKTSSIKMDIRARTFSEFECFEFEVGVSKSSDNVKKIISYANHEIRPTWVEQDVMPDGAYIDQFTLDILYKDK